MNELITGCDCVSRHHRINKPKNNDSNLHDDANESEPTGNSHVTSFNWLCPESLHKIQTESNPDSRDVTSMCDRILETEQQIAEELTEFMFDYDVLNIRRQELLHHRWTERVYNPIRSRVLSRLNSKDYENLRLYKHLLYNEFLTKTNRKEYVSLYAPVQLENGDYSNMPLSLSARFGQLNDPLQQSERTRIEEDRTAMQCVTGERFSSADIERLRLPATPLLSLGRQGTSWKQWTRVNACNIESPEHQKSRLKMNPNKNLSQVAWDCYYRPCADELSSSVRAVAPSSRAASVAAAEQLCDGEQQQQSCPQTSESPSGDGSLQIVAHAT